MFANLEAKLIVAAIIALVIGGLILSLIFVARSDAAHKAEIATLAQQVQIQQSTISTIQADAAATKRNQETLFSSLSAIRVEAEQQKAKIVIPKSLLGNKSSAKLTQWLNRDTQARLDAFEALTR